MQILHANLISSHYEPSIKIDAKSALNSIISKRK